MKKCSGCEALIDEKYSQCIKCLNKTREVNNSEELLKVLTWGNWNWGSSAKMAKLSLLNDLENNKNKTEVQNRIHKLLLKDLEKDIKNVEEISEQIKKQKV